jgi:hypothetical protein
LALSTAFINESRFWPKVCLCGFSSPRKTFFKAADLMESSREAAQRYWRISDGVGFGNQKMNSHPAGEAFELQG